uniref:Uncharacterized protein n=1 Tax=Strongyloides venezuelensis TaxID=75913 RepID=A0A0K0FHR2_STRVS
MKISCIKVLLYSFFILILGVSNTLQHLEGFPGESYEPIPFGHHDILMKHVEETQDLFAELEELLSEKWATRTPNFSLKI